MLSISTAFNVSRHRSWASLVSETRELGFTTVELNVEIPEAWMPDIERSVEQGDIRISSLHNFCPRLDPLPPERTVFSGYFLTALEEEERGLAVRFTRRTVEWAARLGARAVVIHAGSIPTDPSGGELFRYIHTFGSTGKLFRNYLDTLLRDRAKKSGAYIDVLKKSLDECLGHAQRHGVSLCLENRFFVHEVPDISEMTELFAAFPDAPLAYWHDTGHAEISVRLGWVQRHEDYLRELGSRMMGMHLHDVRGISDHFAPGTGELDFGLFKPYVTKDTIRVVEAHAKSSLKEVRGSIGFLSKQGLLAADK